MRRFNDPDDRNRPPEDLTAWLAAGMRRVEAQAWRRWNFSLQDATSWRGAGVGEALSAAQWNAAGVTPQTVGEWFAARIGVAEAIRWHEFGFDLDAAKEHIRQGRGPEAAYQIGQIRQQAAGSAYGTHMQPFLQAGVPHTVMGTYIHLQWTDKDAIPWAKAGVPAWDAKQWQEIGLTPAEAGELAKADRHPMDVLREWWGTGVPYDELADWLGAGLSAEEAVAQRAAGVTREQAAALRALRRGGAL